MSARFSIIGYAALTFVSRTAAAKMVGSALVAPSEVQDLPFVLPGAGSWLRPREAGAPARGRRFLVGPRGAWPDL
jgi:hypothetical protein